MPLLTPPKGNPKTAKNSRPTYILHLAPARRARRSNVCPDATPACLAACLNLAGRGGMISAGARTNSVQRAREARTRLFFDDRKSFFEQLHTEIVRAVSKFPNAAFRLNGTSDIAWEDFDLLSQFPSVPFYDYTKSVERYSAFLSGNLPPNYHLTFSHSENNLPFCLQFLERNGTVAIVFEREKSEKHIGFPVFDGDQNDYRIDDPLGHWIGLRFKGRIIRRRRAIKQGFVQ